MCRWATYTVLYCQRLKWSVHHLHACISVASSTNRQIALWVTNDGYNGILNVFLMVTEAWSIMLDAISTSQYDSSLLVSKVVLWEGGIHLAVAKFSLTTSSVCQSSFWLKGNPPPPPPPRPCMLTTEWNETTQVSGPGTVTNKTLPSLRVLMMYFQQMQLCAHSICWMWLLWAHQTPHPLIYLCRPQKFQSVVGD